MFGRHTAVKVKGKASCLTTTSHDVVRMRLLSIAFLRHCMAFRGRRHYTRNHIQNSCGLTYCCLLQVASALIESLSHTRPHFANAGHTRATAAPRTTGRGNQTEPTISPEEAKIWHERFSKEKGAIACPKCIESAVEKDHTPTSGAP